jgi:5'-3' exonuclease/20S proteasome alpha/beta subunit
MGVPKFFRWISERYPKINQRYGSPADDETCMDHFGNLPPTNIPVPDPLSECGLPPEIDRLYIDMNGIIHGCSHNNSNNSSERDETGGTSGMPEERIFQNICYYLDRVVRDIAKPNELIYMAIDGVAPRAKLNQQRARRYRAGKEGEIEQTVYDAHRDSQNREREEELAAQEDANNDYNPDENLTSKKSKDKDARDEHKLREVSPGRFAGKFETHDADVTTEKDSKTGTPSSNENDETGAFSSVVITPGTPFFQRCTAHIEHFIQYKLSTDPAWQHLTIVFSGPNVPGEGEHKIMQFMREQRERKDYNPNLRHCIMGQDGDLVMLGLVTHEPNLVLLREQVIFDQRRRAQQIAQANHGLDLYIHNANFEFLHMNVLRDYLAFEFEASNVLPDSAFDLEAIIDDFVFMTFFVGNDFLPHMPALDIADEAFDLMFYTYREERNKWLKESRGSDKKKPYLTDAGTIVSGKRLEQFLSVVGGHESPYYDYKKSTFQAENERFRRSEVRTGLNTTPSEREVATKEGFDRSAYREMLQSTIETQPEGGEETKSNFIPVVSRSLNFKPQEDTHEDGLFPRMGSLLEYSFSGIDGGPSGGVDDQDVKGRYYYDKFGFSPFDAEKHIALRKAYIEGLVWNLKYYYQGCVSWEWYYPYHYGPMMSDLVDLDQILNEVSFEGKMGEPLAPFEQLMACLPPSYAHLLPQPYQGFMTDPASPIAKFYPRSFTVDMNGKRWPWEAVTLLPFIDSKELFGVSQTVSEKSLSPEELARNRTDHAVVFAHDPKTRRSLAAVGEGERFGAFEECTASIVPFDSTPWNQDTKVNALFKPMLVPGVEVPLSGLPTLRDGSVQSMWRKRIRVNVFGSASRYKTACLELNDALPEVVPIDTLASHLVGTTVFINYPHLIEAFVTAISDSRGVVRGRQQVKNWSSKEANSRRDRAKQVMLGQVFGERLTGTGGLALAASADGTYVDEVDVLLHVRPLQGLKEMPNGTTVKTFAKFEVDVPLFVTAWAPVKEDSRITNTPALLEKDPFNAVKKGNGPESAKQTAVVDTGSSSVTGSGALDDVQMIDKLSLVKLSQELESRGLDTSGTRDELNVRLEEDVALHLRYSAQWEELTKAQLKEELKSRGLKVSGRKAEMMSRLGAFVEAESTTSSPDLLARMLSISSRQFSTVAGPGPNNLSRGCSTFSRSRLTQMAPAVSSRRRFGTNSTPLRQPVATLRGPSHPRGRLAAVCLVAAASFLSNVGAIDVRDSFAASLPPKLPVAFTSLDWHGNQDENAEAETYGLHANSQSRVAPLEFAHGTTTLSFVFQGGIIAAVDSRASLGSFVGSKTTQKVLPINSHTLGTMAGGAADCSFWIRKLRAEAALHELTEGRRMSVSRTSRLLSNALYQNRGLGLSVGTMIMGFDDEEGAPPRIFYVDNTGMRIAGDLFAVGSGSTFALGILDTQEKRYDMSADEAVALGIKAIRHATFRDAYSGGFINVFLITKNGWERVFTEDLASAADRRLNETTTIE